MVMLAFFMQRLSCVCVCVLETYEEEKENERGGYTK